jgi:hypothetical protein
MGVEFMDAGFFGLAGKPGQQAERLDAIDGFDPEETVPGK